MTEPTKKYITKLKTKTPIKNGETCVIPTYRNGCKSSEKILWMIQFLNTETHTQVLLMDHLQSLHLREVRIGVNIVLKFNSRKTDIARSARGPKSEGPRAEDALAGPYLELQIWVT